MRRACTRSIVVAGFLGGASWAASGETRTPPWTDLTYRTQGKRCPSKEDFAAQVQRALASSPEVPPRDKRHFMVVLGDHRGSFGIGTDEEGPPTRELQGANCAEVGSAVALSLALAIAPPPIDPSPPAASSSPPPRPPPSSSPPAVPRPSPRPNMPLGDATESQPAPWFGGFGVVSEIGATTPAIGGALFLDLPHNRVPIVAPHLRLGVVYRATVTPSSGAVEVHRQWFLVRTELCGLRMGTPAYGVRLCLALDAGAILSRPTGLPNAETSLNAWLAPGIGLRSFWERPDFLFELGAGISLPVPRYKYFYYDHPVGHGNITETPVSQIQAVGAMFFLGVAHALF